MLLGKVSKIICVLFVENSTKGGGGGLAVLQVLVRIFEKMLKVLQMLQFIQKWREIFSPFIDPPPQLLTHQEKLVAGSQNSF